LLFVERAANRSVVGLGKRGLSEKFTTAIKLENKRVTTWIVTYNVASTSLFHHLELLGLDVLARREF
jgi:hypothetical protein